MDGDRVLLVHRQKEVITADAKRKRVIDPEAEFEGGHEHDGGRCDPERNRSAARTRYALRRRRRGRRWRRRQLRCSVKRWPTFSLRDLCRAVTQVHARHRRSSSLCFGNHLDFEADCPVFVEYVLDASLLMGCSVPNRPRGIPGAPSSVERDLDFSEAARHRCSHRGRNLGQPALDERPPAIAKRHDRDSAFF